jgi:hypothetical protein
MPHRDSNDNQEYDFVDGNGDPPYTNTNGDAITDSAEVTVASAPAAVTFTEQTTDGTSVTVDSVRVDEGGFVTMHDSSLFDDEPVGSVVGTSGYLVPGSYQDVSVSLNNELNSDQELTAMPHRDSNDNQTYDFVDGTGDPPYTDGDGAVTDTAQVTIEDDGIVAEAPGFGLATGVAGLGGLAAYAYRRLNLDSEPPTPENDGLDDGQE